MMRLLMLSLMALITSPLFSQIFTSDFENPGTNPTMSENCNDGSEDYFDIVTDADIAPTFGVTGSYLAAQDTDGSPCSMVPQTATWTGIDISGCSGDLYLCLDLAEDDDGSNEDWDASDQVLITYSIDGMASEDLVGIQNDGSTFNSAPSLDTDCDGVGDGAEITQVFTTYCFLFNQNGNSLDLQIEFSLNAGDEDIAIDNVEVYCDVPSVAPTTVNCAAAAPVDMVGFEGALRNDQVYLNWTTASEVNNDFFEVQHSKDGSEYETIGIVNGMGNSNVLVDYSFIHMDANAETNLYRLRQVDYNGSYEYSDVVLVRIEDDGNIKIYPSHALEAVNIDFGAPLDTDLELVVFDNLGKRVSVVNLRMNEISTRVDISELAQGTYFIRFDYKGINTKRFIKL